VVPPCFLQSLDGLRSQLKMLRVQRVALTDLSELLGGDKEGAVRSDTPAFRKLEHLAVNHCQLVAVSLHSLRRVPNLRYLELQVGLKTDIARRRLDKLTTADVYSTIRSVVSHPRPWGESSSIWI
jgi:hypothetical protein